MGIIEGDEEELVVRGEGMPAAAAMLAEHGVTLEELAIQFACVLAATDDIAAGFVALFRRPFLDGDLATDARLASLPELVNRLKEFAATVMADTMRYSLERATVEAMGDEAEKRATRGTGRKARRP